ncbi:hypothetical protein F2Q70_00020968 [Brassica cretica]|uniref:Uncharacterized protein n=1 Tax=Brassica cretica TaxID=69181 RepID=A0A3N6UI64_BRACR|nr:hypothetical protein F2Q70_00020968 [Brassica cretica]KAF3607716.1 hypothetical protein DY000_02046935 [Brassica cretica]
MENFREAINSTKGRKGKSKPPLGGVYKDVKVEEATVRVRKMVVKEAVEEMFLQWSGEADDPQHAIPKKQVVSRLRQPNPRSSSSLVQCPYSIDDFLELLKNNGNPIDDLTLLKSMYTKFRIRCIFCFLQQFESEQLNNLVLELFQGKKVVSRVRKPNPRSSSSLVQCPYSIDDFWELPLQENSGILRDIPTENEILGISRGISEEIPRKHKIGFPRNFLGIPRKYQSVGIFRGNSEEKWVLRKKPMNSEEIL